MRKIHGFTLIELMVTLAVAAVVMGIAIPSFNTSMRNNSSVTLGSELSVALNYARSEAVKRAARVSVCASNDGTTCMAANNWKEGWLVFVDTATSDSAAAVTVGTVLRYWDDLNPDAVITAKRTTDSIAISFLRFTSTGTLARLGATDNQSRTFNLRVTGCKGNAAIQVTVGIAGMLGIAKQQCP